MKEITIKIEDERVVEMINLLEEYHKKMYGIEYVKELGPIDGLYEQALIEGLISIGDVGAETKETHKIVNRIYEILKAWGW